MKNSNTTTRSIPWNSRRLGGAVALAAALALVQPVVTHAQTITPPVVPPGLEVLAPNEVFLVAHGVGTQNYECQPAGTLGHVAWTLFTPQATLFNDLRDQLITHFSSPNPIEGDNVRVTWQDSADTSRVWARATASDTDPPTELRWVRVDAVGTPAGPPRGGALSRTTFIQRVNTEGGLAPATGCDHLNDAGRKAFVPYAADYVFYTQN
jgi:hypothetical protein